MNSPPLGMYAWFGYPLPLEQRVKLIAQAGFTTTCLWYGEEEDLFAGNMADRMPALARAAGLSVDNIHAPFRACNGLWSDSRSTIAAAIDPHMLALDFCHRHGIPVLVIHVSKGVDPPPPTQSGLRALLALVQRAEELGLTVAVENTRSPLHCDFVLSGIESHHLGFCYDSSHDFISGNSPCRLLREWGSRLVTTHFSDNNGVNDDHFLPGNGRVNWDVVRDAFPRIQYSGALMLEVVPRPNDNMTPVQFTQTAHARALNLGRILGQQRHAGDGLPRA
jgi:sugar phosphate isomerase/epimerase